MIRLRTLVLSAATIATLSGVATAQGAVNAPSASAVLPVSVWESMGLSLVGVPASWSAPGGVDISAGGSVNLGSLVVNPSWLIKNGRIVTVDVYFTQDLTGAAADGSPTIPVSAFSGTKQVGSGSSSTITWAGAGAANAVTLLSGTTGLGAGQLPFLVGSASTAYDITFGLSLAVPANAYPSTYTTTLTFRAYAN